MNELEKVRAGAVGLSVDPELLERFQTGHEYEAQIPTRYGSLHVYIYMPKQIQVEYPLLVNIHGGGFVKGYREQDKVFARNMCSNAGYMVVDLDYKTAPEKMYPYALHECYDAIKYLCENSSDYGVDKDKVVVAGHSAGGNFTLGIGIMARDSGDFKIQHLIMDYPPMDLYTHPRDKMNTDGEIDEERIKTAQMYNDWYVSPEYRRDIYVSPVYAAREELLNLPPVLMITAEKDMLNREAEQVALQLIRAGVLVTAIQVPGAVHGFVVRRSAGYEAAEKLIFTVLDKVACDSGK